MKGAIGLLIAMLACGPLTAQAPDWRGDVINMPIPRLIEQVIGTWYEIDANGTPRISRFSPGPKGCLRPYDSELGGDFSLRRTPKGLQMAEALQFSDVAVAGQPNGRAVGLKLGKLTVFAIAAAPDGSPRIYINRDGDGDSVTRFQKCPRNIGPGGAASKAPGN